MEEEPGRALEVTEMEVQPGPVVEVTEMEVEPGPALEVKEMEELDLAVEVRGAPAELPAR